MWFLPDPGEETRPWAAAGQPAGPPALLPLRPTAAALLLASVALAPAAASAAMPRKAAPRPPALQSCTYDAPDDATAPVAANSADEADDDDDDEDDDDDDAGDGADGNVGGLKAGDGCLKVGATLDVGMTLSWLRLSGLARGFGRDLNRTTFDNKATFEWGHVMTSAYGDIATRLALEFKVGSIDVNAASIRFGPVVAGAETSFFDAWTADEFTFRALASSQSPALLGYVWRPSDAMTVSLSAEDNTFRRITLTGYGGSTMPDVVGRFRWTALPFDLTLATAWRETRVSNVGVDGIQGVAALASLKVDLPTKNDGSYVIGQAAWSDRALGYLGINTTTSAFRLPIGTVLSANVAERGSGWNVAGVANWQFAESWSSAAFLSYVSLDIPNTAGTGRLQSTRGAANISWQPVDDFSLTAEFGYARLKSGIPLVPSSTGVSMILSMSRTF
jgi:hypothetical protein